MDSDIALPAGPDGAFLIAQITDLHLAAHAATPVAGVNADDSLASVLKAMRSRLPRDPDIILATGDIADTGAASAYQRFKSYMQDTGIPAYGLPGNHDNPATLHEVWPRRLPRWIDTPAWRIVMLDTTLPGEDAGMLGPAALTELHQALASANTNILVVLHHHPVPVGSQWLDRHMLRDAEAFFDCLQESAGVRAVLCGHVHQELDGRYRAQHDGYNAAIRIMASPSTAFQFAPHTKKYQLDTATPGFRWLLLHPDGHLDTQVHYLQ